MSLPFSVTINPIPNDFCALTFGAVRHSFSDEGMGSFLDKSKGINEKTLSFDYTNHKIEINTADAQKSYMEGVTGCLTRKDNVKRKFAVFFLCSPRKWGKLIWEVRTRNWKLLEGENRLSGLLEGISSVDPYNWLSHPCTWNPTPTNNIQNFLTPIYSDLNTLWPDLKDPLNPTANRIFWKKEWKKHGKCSDYPQNPLEYFDSALRLRQNLLVPDFGLQPGVQYSVKQVEQMVKNVVNGYPEIACNKNIHTGAVQLWEIRLCYDRPTPHQLIQNIRNCPRSTHSNSGARGLCANTMITLP
ncbi:hypothetical protein GQ457_14G001180 [Hibiscus cannabinus]